MSDTIRLFIAAPLPQALKDYLEQSRQVYAEPYIRAVPTDNLHLTLFFLGSVPADELDAIKLKVAELAKKHAAFTLSLAQLEQGPKRNAPRLIWARFQAHEAFTRLSKDLTEIFAPSPPKQEKFIPHVTLCRFKKDARPSRNLPVVQPEEVVMFPISSMALWQSTLGSPHPVYSVVAEFPLD